MQDATMFSALPLKSGSDVSKRTSATSNDESVEKFSSALQRAHGDTREARIAGSTRDQENQTERRAGLESTGPSPAIDTVAKQVERKALGSNESSDETVNEGNQTEESVLNRLELTAPAIQSPEVVGGALTNSNILDQLQATLNTLTEDELIEVENVLQSLATEIQVGEKTPEQMITTVNAVLDTELPSGILREKLKAWLSSADPIPAMSPSGDVVADVSTDITQKVMGALNVIESLQVQSFNNTALNIPINSESADLGVPGQIDLSTDKQAVVPNVSINEVAEVGAQILTGTVRLQKNDGSQTGSPVLTSPATHATPAEYTTPAAATVPTIATELVPKGPVLFNDALKVVTNEQVLDSSNLLQESVTQGGALTAEKASMSPALRSFTVQTAVTPTVGGPEWGEAVGQKVLWLAKQNISFAQIRLDPPDLGPMQIRIQMQNDQAHVSFITQQPLVREVLDQNLVRLREMFNEQGIDLVDVDVSDQSQNSQDDTEKSNHSGPAASLFDEDEFEGIPEQMSESSISLVDHYA